MRFFSLHHRLKTQIPLVCLFFLFSALPALAGSGVPDLSGLTLAQASKALKQAKMKMITIAVPTLLPSQKGKVMKQEPRAGHRLWDRNQSVKVWYYDTKAQDHTRKTGSKPQSSAPPEQTNNVRVPSLMGQHQYEAQATVWTKKLDIAVVKNLPTKNRKAAGTIAFQDPMPQMQVPKGTVISIWVYKYKESDADKGKLPLPRFRKPQETEEEKEGEKVK